MSRRRSNSIAEQFVAHTRSMRESPAWRALPFNARKIIDRLELEHMHQGGHENGRLKCTYGDFEEAGVRRQSIALAIRQAFQLGFIQVMKRGYRAQNGFQVASEYRLTFAFPADSRFDDGPTNEWRFVQDAADAAERLRRAKKPWRRGNEPPRWAEI